MKQSKKKSVRFILKFAKNYLPKKIYSIILFIRHFRKFKKYLNKQKTNIKYSQNLDKINQYEYKLTSQNNEDGIIEHIFSKIPNNKFFIELGFDFYEFNSLNLIKNGWNGLLIEGNDDECLIMDSCIKHYFPKSNVKVLNERIYKDNLNKIILENTNYQEIDFFSLDLDGNDYWIFKNLNTDKIKVICCEYNNYLGNNVKKTIPYNPDHVFTQNGCFGASLGAFTELFNSKGFDLIAIDSSGVNAFFVRKEFSNHFEILSTSKSFKASNRFYTEEQLKKQHENIKNFKFVEL